MRVKLFEKLYESKSNQAFDNNPLTKFLANTHSIIFIRYTQNNGVYAESRFFQHKKKCAVKTLWQP